MRTVRPKERESDILRTIMDGLAAKRILHFRMNSGGMFGQHNGKRWAVKFGRKGMADLVAFPRKLRVPCDDELSQSKWMLWLDGAPAVVWIEIKTATGKQSADQAAFEREVTAEGHRYILCRSWEELLEKL